MTRPIILCTLMTALTTACGDDDVPVDAAVDAAGAIDAAKPDGGQDAPAIDGPAPDAVVADVSAADATVRIDTAIEAGRDAWPEVIAEDPWLFADGCFRNLPAPMGTRNIERKWIYPGNTRLAYVIETGDRLGTSGTMPWAFVAFAAATDDFSECVTAPQRLKYTVSHHNCADTAEVTANGTTWKLTNPDRENTRVTAVRGGTTIGTTDLHRHSCTTNAPNGQCRSGGPCQ